MEKSANWKVRGIEKDKVYEVRDQWRSHVVDLAQGECTCRQWQLSGLPCGHVCAVGRFAGLTSVKKLAKAWFYNTTIKGTYAEVIYPLKDITMWDMPDQLQTVSPPVVGKRQAGRPKKKTGFPLKARYLQGKLVEGVGRQGITARRVTHLWLQKR